MTILSASNKKETDKSATNLYEKGNAYFMSEEYPDALKFYLEAIKLAERKGDNKIISACMGNIGLVFALVNDYERGVHYTRKTYDLAALNGELDKQRRAACLLAELYVNLNQVDSAEYYNVLQKSISDSNNPEANYLSYYNDGLISEMKGNRSLAKYYYNKALEYAKLHELPVKYEIQQLLELGKVNLSADSVEAALKYIKRAEVMSDSIESPNMQIVVYRKMLDCLNARGDTVNTKVYKSKYNALNDSLIDRIRFNAAKNSLYEYEEQRDGLRIKKMQRKIGNYAWGIICVSCILLLVGVFTCVTIRNNRKLRSAQVALVEKMEELTMQGEKNAMLRDRYLDVVEQVEEMTSHERYKAGIPEHQIELMIKKITDVMENTEIISNSQFNLNTLVAMVDSNTTYVSWIINETFGKNFKSLLNEYRVREAVKRLTDYEHYGNMTIQAVYESVGYNSASNFIKAFKTVMGMTPSAYQKLQRSR